MYIDMAIEACALGWLHMLKHLPYGTADVTGKEAA